MMLVMAEKKAILNLRLEVNVRDDFGIAAKLRGASMSGLLHQFIIRTIREEKQMSPQSFGSERLVNDNAHKAAPDIQHKAPVLARIEPGIDPKDEIREMFDKDGLLLPNSKEKMPGKLDKIHTQAKRRTR